MKQPPTPWQPRARVTNDRRMFGGKFSNGSPETIAATGASTTKYFSKAKALPQCIFARGNRFAVKSAKYAIFSTAMIRSSPIPRFTRASVTAPVPGPNSITSPGLDISTCAAIARARRGLDGVGEETSAGFSISPRKKLAWEAKKLPGISDFICSQAAISGCERRSTSMPKWSESVKASLPCNPTGSRKAICAETTVQVFASESGRKT